jgi:3-phosphoshikimate 1-carboxyvinyltransferase
MAGGVQVTNLSSRSLQGDKMLVDLLRRMGAMVEIGRDSVAVRKSRLKAIRADLTDCIDLLPTVAALAAVADGETELTGIERARLKESDRVAAVREGLGRIGIRVVDAKNKLTITGGKPRGAVIDSKNDHRIAMAFSILGVLVGNTIIEGAECVNKTFPEFWAILKGIGGKVRLDGQ